MKESKTAKERYMERMKGVESEAVKDAKYRIANRYWIDECQRQELKRLIEQQEQKTSS